jgi:hypothetical protein
MQAFVSFFLVGGRAGGVAVKAKTSQVPDMFPKEFSVAPHFYWICFGKCCPLFTYIAGPKGKNSKLLSRTSVWGESIVFFFLSDGPIKLALLPKIKLNLGGTSSN